TIERRTRRARPIGRALRARELPMYMTPLRLRSPARADQEPVPRAVRGSVYKGLRLLFTTHGVLLCRWPRVRRRGGRSAGETVAGTRRTANERTRVRLGIAHHLGWAVAVTASDDHAVLDRRSIELVEPEVPVAPIEHELGGLDDAAAARLVARVRASVV